jgi:hypothetical protein
MQRRRTKHALSLGERLAEEAKKLREEAKSYRPAQRGKACYGRHGKMRWWLTWPNGLRLRACSRPSRASTAVSLGTPAADAFITFVECRSALEFGSRWGTKPCRT